MKEIATLVVLKLLLTKHTQTAVSVDHTATMDVRCSSGYGAAESFLPAILFQADSSGFRLLLLLLSFGLGRWWRTIVDFT